jgi:hypothetical protein
MPDPFYLPPAGIDDFGARPSAAAFKQQWQNYIANAIAGRASDGGLFYDAESEPGGAQGPAPIPWNGFPRSITQWFNADTDPNGLQRALAAADVLAPLARVRRADTGEKWLVLNRQQDEYCEWHADRDQAGRITRISFTAEGPEYWQILAKTDPDLLLELYRKHISPAVQREDLFWPSDMIDEQSDRIEFRAGEYNRWNKWTTLLGAMHLTHPANTLGAEINLAADATVIYSAVPPTPTDTLHRRLICCAGYGGVNRSSDPLIGAGVNGFARAGKSVTLANPVGLYISDVPIGGLRGPSGEVADQAWCKIVRASADEQMKLRVEVAPPPGAGFTLDQCTFEGAPLRHGGQIARRITMVLFGLAKDIPGRTAISGNCRGRCCPKADAPNFRLLIAASRNCTSVTQQDWDEVAPLETAVTAAEEVTLPPGGLVKAQSYSRAQ